MEPQSFRPLGFDLGDYANTGPIIVRSKTSPTPSQTTRVSRSDSDSSLTNQARKMTQSLPLTSSNPNLANAPPKPNRTPSMKHGNKWRSPQRKLRQHDYDEIPDEGDQPTTYLTMASTSSPRLANALVGSPVNRLVSHTEQSSDSLPGPIVLPYTRVTAKGKDLALPYQRTKHRENERTVSKLPYMKKPKDRNVVPNASTPPLKLTAAKLAKVSRPPFPVSSPIGYHDYDEADDANVDKSNFADVMFTHAHKKQFLNTSIVHYDVTDTDEQRVVGSDHFATDIFTIYEASAFDVSNFTCNFFPVGNKPLDSAAVITIKSLLLQADIAYLAIHLTKLDCDLLRLSSSHDLGHGLTSGLQLIALPEGAQMRRDVLERYTAVTLKTSGFNHVV